MYGVYEYCLFLLICACVVREFLWPVNITEIWQYELISPLDEHLAWLEHISDARQQDLLGPLRLEQRGPELCVVGLGECRPVPSVEQGVALIDKLKSQIASLFETAK